MEDINLNCKYLTGLPLEYLKKTGKPLPSSYAITWCMHASHINRIFTKEDMKEFLFRLAIVLDAKALVETWFLQEKLFTFFLEEIEYELTPMDIAMHFGFEVADEFENSSSRENFLNSVGTSIFHALVVGFNVYALPLKLSTI